MSPDSLWRFCPWTVCEDFVPGLFVFSGILWWNFAYTLVYWQDVAHELSNDIKDWSRFCRGSNSEKSETIAKWHLLSVEAVPSAKFWKSEIGLISCSEWIILIGFCVNIDIIKRLWNVIFHRSRFGRAPNSEKVKMALFLELSGILWWKFAYTLVYWQDIAHEIVKWHLRLVEVSKKVKLLNRLEYFDKLLQTIWCWKDLAQGIAKWHLSSVET